MNESLEDAIDATAPAARRLICELLLPPLPAILRGNVDGRERANRRRERDEPSFDGGPRVPQQEQHGQAKQPPARR